MSYRQRWVAAAIRTELARRGASYPPAIHHTSTGGLTTPAEQPPKADTYRERYRQAKTKESGK